VPNIGVKRMRGKGAAHLLPQPCSRGPIRTFAAAEGVDR
jgi:hypothetical protein